MTVVKIVDVNVYRCEEEETRWFAGTVKSRENSKCLKVLLAHYIIY